VLPLPLCDYRLGRLQDEVDTDPVLSCRRCRGGGVDDATQASKSIRTKLSMPPLKHRSSSHTSTKASISIDHHVGTTGIDASNNNISSGGETGHPGHGHGLGLGLGLGVGNKVGEESGDTFGSLGTSSGESKRRGRHDSTSSSLTRL
jgi:hypothetical protein